MTVQEGRNLVIPGRAKDMTPPPLSFRSEARNLIIPDRAKAKMPPPLSFRSAARNLVVPRADAFLEAGNAA